MISIAQYNIWFSFVINQRILIDFFFLKIILLKRDKLKKNKIYNTFKFKTCSFLKKTTHKTKRSLKVYFISFNFCFNYLLKISLHILN